LQKNILLTAQTTAAVDARVEKILKDLGNPEPPLNLEDVRALLKLDLRYYSTTDTSWLQEKIHKLKVAGKNVITTAAAIVEVTKSLGLKGILLVEKRRILLDTDQPKPKLRWNEAHEITHDILPWHLDVAHGDPEETLMPSCHEQIEAEANYGAGRLLFCGQGFTEQVRSSELNFALVRQLKDIFGNTITTTLWRTVEASQHAAFGIISVHPAAVTGVIDTDVRYFIRSPKFASEFSQVIPGELFPRICAQCHGRRGPVGQGTCDLTDNNGAKKQFTFETFWNGYDALTLGHHP
jgi:hypothetical protein